MAEVNARKRGTKWQFYFEAARVGDKRQRICKSGFKTKKEALEAGTKALAEYNSCGEVVLESEISVADFAEVYIDYCKSNLKYSTYSSYESVLNAHLLKLYGKHKMNRVDINVAESFVGKLRDKGLSHGTIRKCIIVCKSMFDYAIRRKIVNDNPFRNLKVPSTENRGNPNFAYSDEMIQEFYKIYEHDMLGTLLMFGYHCGLRLSEALAITWDDIDFDNKLLSVNKQLVCKNHVYYFTNPKYNSDRLISMDDKMVEYLKALKKEKESFPVQRKYRVNTDRSIEDVTDTLIDTQTDTQVVSFVVSRKGSYMVSTKYIHVRLDAFKKKGYKVFRPHDLRHTHCTKLLASGLDVKYVQTRLGHKTASTTMNIYHHLTQDRKMTNAELLNALF